MDVDRLIKRKKRIERDGSRQQLAEVTKELADTYYEAGDHEHALREYREQLEICQSLEDKLNVAIANRMIGEIHGHLGNYEEALQHQNCYLEGAKEIGNRVEQQRAYATLGRTYFCLGESLPEKSEGRDEALASARKTYMKSIRLCNDIGESEIEFRELTTMRTRLLLNLGLVMEAQKEYGEAVNLVNKAAGICEANNLKDDFHRTQIALGGIYERQGEYNLALKYFEAAAGTVNNVCLQAEARIFQAELLLKMERWAEARKILVSLYVQDTLPAGVKNQVERCLRTVVTLHNAERALHDEESVAGKLKLYERLGDAAVAASCLDKAVEYYRQMLACAEQTNSDRIGEALLSLAQTLRDVRRHDEAVRFARRELQLCTDPREICRSALFLAELLTASNAPEEQIEQSYQLARKHAVACNDVSLQLTVLQERLIFLKSADEQRRNAKEIEELEADVKSLEKCSFAAGREDEDEDEVDDATEVGSVGEAVCLDELSDVEEELRRKEKEGRTNKAVRRRRSRGKPSGITRNEKGETQLHVACISGNVAAVEKLVQAGHGINVRDHFGWTPLHEAANHGYVEIARLLLKHGANVDDPGSSMCRGVTPLHDAASCGNTAIIRLLIEHGANVCLTTYDGDTVLDCLTQWRIRAGTLSSEDQADYDETCRLLSSMIPASVRKRTNVAQSPRNVVSPTSRERMSACEDYRRTIASLKHRKDPIATPLLDSEQQVPLDDCWLLENDEIVVTDRDAAAGSKRRSSKMEAEEAEEGKELKRQRINETEMEDRAPDEWSFRKGGRQQTSLLSAGFTKRSVSRTPSPVVSAAPEPARLESCSGDTALSKSVTLHVSVDGKTLKTRVEVSDEGVRPALQDVLADLEQQFANDTGCRAKFRLNTVHGVPVTASNVFETVNAGNTVQQFACEVVQLEVPSIVDRYRMICEGCDIDVQEDVTCCLRICESMGVVRLKPTVRKEELETCLKVLRYQKNVQMIELSGHDLHEMGIALNTCTSRWITLQELRMERCDIDFGFLSKLERLPSQLRLLDLGYNPLGEMSEETLGKLLLPLTQLRTLILRCCQLRNLRFLSNGNASLVSLDISHNRLRTDGLCSALQRLRLLNFDLSNAAHSPKVSLPRTLSERSDVAFASMECLELASCDLTDTDVQSVLSRVSNLGRLVLRGNKRVGMRSIISLLGHTPTLSHIDVTGCQTVVEFPTCAVHIENPDVCTLMASMRMEVCDRWLELWRGKASVYKLPYTLAVFKPLARAAT